MTRPHPVVTSASLTGLVQSAVFILGFLGYTDQAATVDAKMQSLVSVGIALVTLGGNVFHAMHAETKVTPVADPKTSDGVPLVPVPPTVPLTP